MTEPEPRKSSALKKACVVRWNIAAPTPAAMTTCTYAGRSAFAGSERTQPKRRDHVAELRERGVSQDFLDVALRDGAERGVERGGGADPHDDGERVRAPSAR